MTEPEPQLTLFEKPVAADVLAAIADKESGCETPVDRINIQIEESGQVAYRMHPSDGGEYLGGVVMVQPTLF